MAISRFLTQKDYETYLYSKNNPKIIHFAGPNKPWNNPQIPMSEFFWKYAKELPFYEEILYANLKTEEKNITYNNKFYKNFWQKIFSVKNLKTPIKTYKVITILGIKIKFTRVKKK